MKTNKEYPATHSMSTAWYVADADGNVGIIDFNENGPVPLETEQTCVEELIFGHEEDYKRKIFLPIDLTDEQIDDLIENPHLPEDEDLWFNCAILIDTDKEKMFFDLVKEKKDFEIELCISKKRGLYKVDAFDCLVDETKTKPRHVRHYSTLQKLLDMNIILKVYKLKNFDMDDVCNNGEILFKKNFDSAPYYIFHQPYWEGALPKCMNVPKHPVKIDQFPPQLKMRVLRVPIRFDDTPSFQIAEWHLCSITKSMSDDVNIVNGCEYDKLPLTNGTEAYIKTGIIERNALFCNYCAEKDKYNCKSFINCYRHWNQNCTDCLDYCFTDRPTVFFIASPFDEFDYSMKTKSDIITIHSVWLPFLSKIPHKFGKYVFEYELKKHISQETMTDLFKRNRGFFEETLKRLFPQVLILTTEARKTLESVYKIENNRIEINGTSYPMFMKAELRKHRKEIEQLAQLPYRGTFAPHVISVDEFEKMKNK